ncbi:MAG: citrate lyase subunit alpha [Spirochaetales bacterium]|nr:citrate lyase subunit alpha [Spirochaetales bacterium]
MNRVTLGLTEAVLKSGLKDGMRISLHHHLRLGDLVTGMVLKTLKGMGFRSLTLCASSLMGESCDAVLKAVRAGVITNIETTGMKEPLSSAVLDGEVPHPVVFRTHGGRARAIEAGDTPIHTAFLAVSSADVSGNANGTYGPNRFGSLGYGLVDAEAARNVILITDTLLENLKENISIEGDDRCQVVEVGSLGDKNLIGGGSLRKSNRPVEKLIARKALEVLIASGCIQEGFSYQAGSGGVSLLVTGMVADYMRRNGIVGSFASGGVTGGLVDLLGEGLFEKLFDVQSFDDAASLSLAENPGHFEMSASLYASPDRPDCIAHKLDVMILSATEVDLDFNLNSITGTDGRILGALGGGPDTAEGAKVTIAVMPSFRGRIPTINQRVNLICTPGKYVDIVITERGVAVNPSRPDLEKQLKSGGIETLPIEKLMNLIYDLTGSPELPRAMGRIVALVEERRGEILDVIRMNESAE